jgi:mono/diheme cytochrome c family protein
MKRLIRLRTIGAMGGMLAIAMGVGTAAADEAAGEQVYGTTCIACHGADGKGVFPGTPDFTDPDGALAKSDEALLSNVINGFQSPGSAMAMPAKGGNPSLTEADVAAVIAYLRSEFGEDG